MGAPSTRPSTSLLALALASVLNSVAAQSINRCTAYRVTFQTFVTECTASNSTHCVVSWDGSSRTASCHSVCSAVPPILNLSGLTCGAAERAPSLCGSPAPPPLACTALPQLGEFVKCYCVAQTPSPTSSAPTPRPTVAPSAPTTANPTTRPTAFPTASPTAPTRAPTVRPTLSPTSAPTVPPSAHCPIGWYGVGARCFHADCTRLTQSAARVACGDHGGFLATVDTPQVQTVVRGLVQSSTNSTAGALPFWIGLREQPTNSNIWSVPILFPRAVQGGSALSCQQ